MCRALDLYPTSCLRSVAVASTTATIHRPERGHHMPTLVSQTVPPVQLENQVRRSEEKRHGENSQTGPVTQRGVLAARRALPKTGRLLLTCDIDGEI